MSNKEYQVIVSQRAAEMMVSHAGFLAGISPEAAERLIDAFQKAAGSLSQMPHRGKYLTGEFIPPNKYRQLVIGKRYLLIYQKVNDTVYIDYVVDGRQDYGWLLFEP